MNLFGFCSLAKSNAETLLFFRIFIHAYLLLVVTVVPYAIYVVVQKYQLDLEYVEYDIRIDNIEKSANKFLSNHFRALEGVSYIASELCPNISMWPNCSIPMRSFEKVVGPLAEIGSLNVRMAPLVTPAQLDGYEHFAINTYAEQGFPDWGSPTVGPHVYSKTDANVDYRMTTPSPLGKHEIFVPVLYGDDLTTNPGREMYDLYSEVRKAHAIDEVIMCAEMAENNHCTLLSGIRSVSRVGGAPLSFSVTPVSCRSNMTTVVGVVLSVIRWVNLVSSLDQLSSDGLTFVLESYGEYFTYSMINGIVVYDGQGDMHETRFDDRQRSFTFYESKYSDVEYNFFIYPNSSFEHNGKEVISLIACFAAVLILVTSALVVLGYDYVVNRQAREREIVSNTKRLFVRYISHEIRTPLNTVHVGLVVLLSELDKARNSTGCINTTCIHSWVDLVNEIQKSSSNATTVLNDLIAYDKIITNQLQMEFSYVLLWDTIMDNIDLFRIQHREKEIKLGIKTNVVEKFVQGEKKIASIEEGEWLDEFFHLVILADDIKIGQVIKNLMSNALKFTPRGGEINIQVTWDKNDECGYDTSLAKKFGVVSTGAVSISIKDSGVGLSADNLQRLFQEGVQFNPNQLQGGQGSGLGLWVSKGFVEQHGGTLTADSEGLGKGSRFTLRLPAFSSCGSGCVLKSNNIKYGTSIAELIAYINCPDEKNKSDTATNKSYSRDVALQSPLTPTNKSENRKVVLVVDDAVSNRKMLCRLLTNNNYICEPACDGAECVRMVTESSPSCCKFDLILMDFEMPVMNGPTATRKLRELGYKLPIVGVTGNVLTGDTNDFVDAGVNAVLSKPLSINKLQECLIDLKILDMGTH